MIVLPFTPTTSVWCPDLDTVHYLSTGDIIPSDDPRAVIHPPFHAHLNEVPIGKALALAAASPLGTVWAFTLTNTEGKQRAYHGTAAEASNGKGTSRIEGALSLSVWCGLPGVARKAQRPREDPGLPAPVRKANLHIKRAAELVAERTLSQGVAAPAKGRRAVLNYLYECSESISALGEVERHGPSRKDVKVFWE